MSPSSTASRPPHAEPDLEGRDQEAQAVVLDLVLSKHPTQLTVGEITLALAAGSSFGERDQIEQAIKELAQAGLVRCQLEAVVPTWPALRFKELASYWL